MPTQIRIFHAHDFIKVTPTGHLDFERSKKLLIDIAAATTPLINHQIILDTRKAQSEMTITDLYNLTLELSQHCQAFSQKLAVLCPRIRFDQIGFFALCAKNRGFQVQGFTSFEDAVEWLIADAPATSIGGTTDGPRLEPKVEAK